MGTKQFPKQIRFVRTANMRDVTIALVCMHSETGEIDKNLDRTESLVSDASKMGADILCFPELSTTGYTLEDPMGVYGDLSPAAVAERIVVIARNQRVIIMAGIIEPSSGGKPYISHMVAGPDGLLGLYRKTHLSPQEKKGYRAGEKIRVFCHNGITFGIQLCYEAHFPEISTVMALKGADIIFMPHASPRGTPGEKTRSWLRHLPARAFDNGLFLAACNPVGKTKEGFSFPGVALVVGPDGKVLARYAADEEQILFVKLEDKMLRAVRDHRMKYFLPQRRPALYDIPIR